MVSRTVLDTYLTFDLSFFTNADVVTIKDETSKKIRETDAGPIDFHWFHDFFRSLIFEFSFFTNADVVTIKICETNSGKIKKQDVPLTQDRYAEILFMHLIYKTILKNPIYAKKMRHVKNKIICMKNLEAWI